MFGMLFAAPFNTWFGTFYDWTGSYDLTIGVSALCIVIVLVLIMAAAKNSKKAPAHA